jgi:thiol-disulfide isomerase/thioredoxin
MKARLAGGALLAVLLAVIVTAAVRVSGAWSQVRTVTTPSGTLAPDFASPLLDGGTFRLSEARGGVVALAFWATWCEPCREELPQLDALSQRMAAQGVHFYAVNIESMDRKPSIEQFKNGIRLTMPIVLDGNGAAEQYKVETIPHLVIVDRAGRVAQVLDGVHPVSDVESALRLAGRQ